MHYSNLVIIEREEEQTVDDAVTEMMDERADWWDFYQTGGRWTGLFDGYDPDTDPANIKVCDVCNGTGKRPGGALEFGKEWVEWSNGCNGCSGKGKCPVWPTNYKRHEGDVMPIENLTAEQLAKFH